STTWRCWAGRQGRSRSSSRWTSWGRCSSSSACSREGLCSTVSASSGSTVSGFAACRTTTSSSGCCRSCSATWTPWPVPARQALAGAAEDDFVALRTQVRQRLPTLAAIGPLLDLLFVEDLKVDPALLVPKRWDRPTTYQGLTEARALIARTGEVSFEADEVEAA